MKTDTPRTDSQFTSKCRRIGNNGTTYDEDHVASEFARQLERELNGFKERMQKVEAYMGGFGGKINAISDHDFLEAFANSISRSHNFREERDALRIKVAELEKDKARLDWLADQTEGYGNGWIFRTSVNGRGKRLHEHSGSGTSNTPRLAIDAAMKGEK